MCFCVGKPATTKLISIISVISMEQRTLKNVNNSLDTNIYSYLETPDGQSSNLYLNVVYFSTPVSIRHQWQLNTVVFQHWCLICAVLLATKNNTGLLN